MLQKEIFTDHVHDDLKAREAGSIALSQSVLVLETNNHASVKVKFKCLNLGYDLLSLPHLIIFPSIINQLQLLTLLRIH